MVSLNLAFVSTPSRSKKSKLSIDKSTETDNGYVSLDGRVTNRSSEEGLQLHEAQNRPDEVGWNPQLKAMQCPRTAATPLASSNKVTSWSAQSRSDGTTASDSCVPAGAAVRRGLERGGSRSELQHPPQGGGEAQQRLSAQKPQELSLQETLHRGGKHARLPTRLGEATPPSLALTTSFRSRRQDVPKSGTSCSSRCSSLRTHDSESTRHESETEDLMWEDFLHCAECRSSCTSETGQPGTLLKQSWNSREVDALLF